MSKLYKYQTSGGREFWESSSVIDNSMAGPRKWYPVAEAEIVNERPIERPPCSHDHLGWIRERLFMCADCFEHVVATKFEKESK